MRYLIDGHNLIARLPDLDLADPDDEAKLVYKLRSFAARTGKQATVVFDGGLPGGVSARLSNNKVTAIFASDRQSTADKILLGLIRKARSPRAYTLVTSDSELLSAAQTCGMPTLTAALFAEELTKAHLPSADEEKEPNPRLTAAEIEAWLAIFSAKDE